MVLWEQALQAYEGTLCFISHDEHFIRAVGTKVIEVDSGKVTVYPANYESYLYMKSKEQEVDSPFSALTRRLKLPTVSDKPVERKGTRGASVA